LSDVRALRFGVLSRYSQCAPPDTHAEWHAEWQAE
jgi:hypothetical protein